MKMLLKCQVLLALFLFALNAHALTLFEQVVADTLSTQASLSSGAAINLGTGHTGTLDGLRVKMSFGDYVSGSNEFVIRLICYSDEYSTQVDCVDGEDAFGRLSDGVNRSLFEGQENVYINFSFDGYNSTYGVMEFDETRYYRLAGYTLGSYTSAGYWGTNDPPDNCVGSSGACATLTDIFYQFYDEGGVTEDDPRTRIIDFNPQDLDVIASTTPIEFDVTAYINPADLGSIQGIRISLTNIDQNDLLFGPLSQLSAEDFVIVDEEVATSGVYYYATTTDPLPEGNYRVRACLRRSVFGLVSNYVDVFTNVVQGTPDCLSHQFIVGTSTFIGNLSQAGFDELNDFVTGLTATSTEALAAQCNPLNSNFGIRECLLYLLIPSGENFQAVVTGLRDGILVRVPWGYVTRAVTILSSSSTTTIPSFTASIRVGTSEYEELTFDPADMIAGAGTLLDGIQDPIYEKNLEDVFRPIIQAIVAMLVLFTIMSDIMGSHKHNEGREK